MKRNSKGVIANQVFIGCPWKGIRPKYDRITKDLNKTFPLSFILVGRELDQKADDLLTIIKTKLLSSNSAIFDVTGGNPNVSLEFGIAESNLIECTLYFNVHKSYKSKGVDSAIISDLAGKRRKEYKQEKVLRQLLRAFSKNHTFSTRFEKCLKAGLSKYEKGDKKRFRSLALKTIHLLDDKSTVRRDDLVHQLENDYKNVEIEAILGVLKKNGLIRISTGRYSLVSIS